jgi:hypothetical protein
MSKRDREHLTNPPPAEPPDDLAEAVQARKAAEKALHLSRARRGRVDRAVRALKEIRRINHFATALDQISRDAT